MSKTFKDSRPARETRKERTKKAGEGKKHRDQNLWKRMWNEELLTA